RRHGFQEHHAERLTVEGRRAEHVGAAEPARLLVVVDRAEPLDAVVAARAGTEDVGLRAVAAHPESDLRGEARHRFEQHRQALAWFVATHEEDRRALRGPGCRLGEPRY